MTLNIILGIVQIVLAGLFLMSGGLKAIQPVDKLSDIIPWAGDVPLGLVRFIGISELLGALGLVLPALLRIKPHLTSLAAIGIAIIMVLAIAFHVSRGETAVIGMNITLALFALFVAWGRFRKAPVLPKSYPGIDPGV